MRLPVFAAVLEELCKGRSSRGNRADMISAMAKLIASEACVEIAQVSVRVHGGHGYIKDYHVVRLRREAELNLVGEGTSDIQKLAISRPIKDGSEYGTLGLPL